MSSASTCASLVYCDGAPPDLLSFPTRRSSDLCDNEGQLERLEELLGVDRATLAVGALDGGFIIDRKSTRLNSSHLGISYAVFCLKKKNIYNQHQQTDSGTNPPHRHDQTHHCGT